MIEEEDEEEKEGGEEGGGGVDTAEAETSVSMPKRMYISAARSLFYLRLC